MQNNFKNKISDYKGGKSYFLYFITLAVTLSLGFELPGSLTKSGNSSSSHISENSNRFNFYQAFLADSTDSTDSILALDSLNAIDSTKIDTTKIDSTLIPESKRKKSLYFHPLFTDTTGVDSLIQNDSTMWDSTARVEQFKYVRKDNPNVEFRERKKSQFFAYPGQGNLQRTVELDSTGQYVLIKEKLVGQEEKVYLKMKLEEYIDLRMQSVNKTIWEQQAYKYELGENKNDLGQLLTDITNIEIPLPSAGFLSIFGPNIIKLRINGSVDIHGAWRNETTEGLTASRLGNTRNEPDFSQQVQISVNGTIGDKLKINADWNTERTFEYENQLKIIYDGYDDEIVKKVEAGNVSLQTSPLVGGSEALFGVKADFQFGPFSLTTLASQKKGEVTEVNLSGGSEKKTFEIHAWDYSENHYFIDEVYANTDPNFNFFENYYDNPSPLINANNAMWQVLELEVWKSTIGLVDQGRERKANAYIDKKFVEQGSIDPALRDTSKEPVPGESVIGERFIQLTDGVDYTFNDYTGVISFKTQIQKSDVVAAAFKVKGTNGTLTYGDFINDLPQDSLIILKLIKPKDLNTNWTKAWALQLRNIYPLRGRDIKEEGFTLDITYELAGQEARNDVNNVKLLEAFGFDKIDASGTPKPDAAFDFVPGITILPLTGEIIFPKLRPFHESEIDPNLKDYAYNDIYETTKTFAQQNKEKDKFLIKGEYSASVSSTYSIGFNVVENSVRVTLNGATLSEGSDYAVDYNIGQVTIRNDAALVPGADLKISFEQNDLFSLASKTLLGLRGIYEFSKRTKVGFSFLNLNQKTLSDKVRIGEEPISNTIYGLDFETGADLPFITKGLDYLISTRATSSIDVKGEFAYMDPDPNTKKSTIQGDNSESIAYVDDFEGAKRTIPIGISYTSWKDLSIPFDLSGEALRAQMSYKGKSFWYNILPSDVDVNDIWPEKRVSRQDQQQTVLDFVFRPTVRGMYNNFPKIDENPLQNWGGMMKALSSTASNLIEEKIEFIELWYKPEAGFLPQGAKLIIDVGQISEDVIPNGKLDTEDPDGNDNLASESEDRGIDFKSDANEDGDPNLGADKADDNFRVVQGSRIPDDYVNINGTEGNFQSADVGRFPDSEDLNRNLTLDRLNSYFRYEIPLDTNRFENPFIAGGGGHENAWYQIKIPLIEWNKKIGDPSFQNVEFIRLWATDLSEELHIRIADFNFVGNQWEKNKDVAGVTDSDKVMIISTISVEDNPEYIIPPGVKREKDRSKPDEEVLKNEQAIQFEIVDLADSVYREAVKYLYRPLDLFNYSKMKLFVRGDQDYTSPGSVSYFNNLQDYAAEVYFRFGSDNNNYYEYRQPLQFNTKAGTAGWDEISIDFDVLTAIKEKRDSVKLAFYDPVPGREGHFYGVKGNPTLTRIAYFIIGIENPEGIGDSNQVVSGKVWINELRVLGADNTKGWAYSLSTSLKLADLLSVSFNTKRSDPYFHKLNERFGNREDNKSWSVNANLDVMKLIPANMEGSNLKLNYSHSENFSERLYKPQTDILVEQAAMASSNPDSVRKESQTLSIKDTWTLSNIKLKIPTEAWYINETINNLSFGFTYNKSFSRNPTTLAQRSWVWDSKIDYSLNFSRDNFFYPSDIPLFGEFLKLFDDYKDVKVYFSPQSFSTNVSAKRNYNFTKYTTLGRLPDIQQDFTASRGGSFNWNITEGGLINIGIDYSADASSSLAHLLYINDQERPESAIWNDIFSGAAFGRDYNYTQSFSFKTSPNLPSLLNLNRFLKVDFDYRVQYNWKNDFRQEELGRSASYNNNINANLNLRLKSIMDPIFGEEDKSTSTPQAGGVRSRNNKNQQPRTQNIRANKVEQADDKAPTDSTAAVADSTGGESKIMMILGSMKYGIKYLLFDYEQLSFGFSQNNSRGGGALAGEGSGFGNFWGIRQKDSQGPSRLFMLGLSNNLGLRSPGASVQETFSQKNSFDFKTSRPLWEGAKIDINWKVGWGFNRNTTIRTDSTTGEIMISSISSTGNLDRSFFTVPVSFFNTSLKRVNELYNPKADNPNQNLADAFVNGLESFPLLSKIPILKDVSKYVPRPNWRISWSGLEKISIFEGIAKRVRLDHAYTSAFSEGWKVNSEGSKEIQTQKISYGFSPLIGLDIQFEELWGGNLGASAKYNVKTNYDLGLATKNISESLGNDISLTASFSKAGFSLPLFGISLKNDIEFSFSYTLGKNSVVIYKLGDEFTEKGTPQDGTTRTSMEPRIKFVMSSRVTLSIFYKRSSVVPEGASRIPPTTTNEAGLDVHIAIQ